MSVFDYEQYMLAVAERLTESMETIAKASLRRAAAEERVAAEFERRGKRDDFVESSVGMISRARDEVVRASQEIKQAAEKEKLP